MKNKDKILILIIVFLYNLEVLAKDIDCKYMPKFNNANLITYCGYHTSNDKSGFWIPPNINPLMMTDKQLEIYRIIDTKIDKEYNYNTPFYQHYIKKAQEYGRPFIRIDVINAQNDSNIVGSLRNSLKDWQDRLGSLNSEQEKQLKYLQKEYGEDSEIFDEEFKHYLNLYRQRQKYKQDYEKAQDEKFKQNYPIIYRANRFLEKLDSVISY
ncbi:hypothetical protein IJ732_07925 [bacterium]|nr:hypothetical protein [bacterium]